ncbi:hypothetical protein QYE76_009887 [Lolium multiflorum]|uniref:Retrotransposon gag domain-containing protein n=1 Tax=Lolium multiflorum TaxID=4521 RepID=A0AAD8TSQ2_LOLMU|nr:hypothetical protein QYE76_009887 [Lolium multiflorum]
MEQFTQTKFYQLGNGGSLIFEKDLKDLAEYLEHSHLEFFGGQVNDQPGGNLQWVIIADLRGKLEPPMSERIQFSLRENNWADGLARAMHEALARLCGQNLPQIRGTRFVHLARHDSMGAPMDLSPHPEVKYHVEHLDFMLCETRMELENSRAYANQTYLQQVQQTETIKILAKERKTLRHGPSNPQQQPRCNNADAIDDGSRYRGSKLKNFQNTNPPIFSKTEEPLDADDWLQSMENNLEVAGVDAAEKVLFATHYLSGPARAWWNSARAMNGGQMMTWEDFKLIPCATGSDQEDEG